MILRARRGRLIAARNRLLTARSQLVRCLWLFAAFAGSTPLAAQSGGRAPSLSLDDAVMLARQQNRPLQIARVEVERASEQFTAFRTQKLPLFDVKVSSGSLVAPLDVRFKTGALGVSPIVGPIPTADTSIRTGPRISTIVFANVAQPLTQLPRLAFGEQAARLNIDVAAEEVRAREAEIVAAVKKLYYGIVQAESAIRARDKSVSLSRELVRIVDAHAAERVALAADALTARAGLSEQEHQVMLARNAAQGYREQLNALLARDLDEPFEVVPLQPATPRLDDLQAAEARAVLEHPAVRLRRLQSQRAEAAVRATKQPGVPDLSLSFNYVGFYNFEVLPQHGALVGVTATWEPWDWGRARAQRQEKQLLKKAADTAAAEAEAQIRVQLRATFRALQEAFALVSVSEAAREAARERLRVITDRFGQDAALERDLLEAQTRLAAADQAYSQVLAGYWTARAEFERARADP